MLSSEATSANDASSKVQAPDSPTSAARARARSTWAGLKSQPHTSTSGVVAATMQADTPLPLPRSIHVRGRSAGSGGWPWSTELIEMCDGHR
jgi:hypothetical protein